MIDTIINYCTIDFKFIEKNITECLKFSDNVAIPVCDHLLDGTLEDQRLLEKTFALQELSPNISFLLYEWNPNENAKYHHNVSRYLGLDNLPASPNEYVLFLDSDEIVNGDLLHDYLNTNDHINYDALALECYWYFREQRFRATTTEMAGVLLNKQLCLPDNMFHREERWFYRYLQNVRVREHVTYNGQIMCNHYSWVRSKEEMMKKVVSWAHSTEKNWTQLVEDEFSREFNGTDFVHGYAYEILND